MAGQLAVVTGASSGLGVEFAKQLARRGHDLMLVARSTDAMEELASQVRAESHVEVTVRTADLTDASDLAAVVHELGTLEVEVLVNNAGFGTYGRFDEIDAGKEHDEVLVNVLAVTALAHAVVPGMVSRRRGGIINVSSTASFQPTPWMTTYGATKAYVRSFSLGLAADLQPFGVRVTALCPGPVETKFFDEVGHDHDTPGAVLTAEAVVAAGLAGFDRGKLQVIPGRSNQFGAMSSRFAPMSLVLKVGRRALRPKTPRKVLAPAVFGGR
jgi:uncharacterized protein